jgi:hypothetical protein
MVKIGPSTEAGHRLGEWAHEGVSWDEETWKQIVEIGKARERGVVNRMSDAQLRTFIQTFGDKFPYMFKQLNFDMLYARYRLFDELAMMVMSRTKGYGEPEEVERKAQEVATDWARRYLTCAGTTITQDQLYDCFVDSIQE